MKDLSELQVKILQILTDGARERQRDIAAAADTHQPSISRSLRPLMESGLVARNGKGYALTEAGRRIANAYKKETGLSDRDSIRFRLMKMKEDLRKTVESLELLIEEL